MFEYLYISLIIIITSGHVHTQQDEAAVREVYVIFNSGKHAPVKEFYEKFPNYAEKENLFKPYGPGNLTQEGKEQMFRLGAKLKRMYVPSVYSRRDIDKEINMTTMQNPRSLMSARLVVAGLLDQNRTWALYKDWTDKELHWHVEENAELDKSLNLFHNNDNCKYNFISRARDYFKKKIPIDQQKNIFSKYNILKKQIKNNLRAAKLTHHDMWKVYDTFISQRNANVSLPDWLTEDLLLDMKDYLEKYMEFEFGTEELRKRSAGIFVKIMIDFFRARIRYDTKTFRLLSVNDLNFAAIVAALGGSKNYKICGRDRLNIGWPKSGAAIIAEVHIENKSRDKYYQFWYLDPDSNARIRLYINGCKSCIWFQYYTDTSKIMVTQPDLRKCTNEAFKLIC